MKKGRYTIGEISRLCNISISKLRYLDERGVLTPSFVDMETGYRYYDEETLLQISVLNYYQKCGFKLREMEPLLRRMDLDRLATLFDRHIETLQRKITSLQMQCDSIAAWRGLIAEQRAAVAGVVRHVWYHPTAMRVSRNHHIGGKTSYKSLITNIEMEKQSNQCDNMGIGALYLYFPQQRQHCLADARIYIHPHPLETSDVPRETIGGHGALVCYHTGAFEQCADTYQLLAEYAAAHAIPLRGDSYERSVIDYWSTKNEAEFLLEIILPTKESTPLAGLPQRSF